ncbi:PREDICTED: cortistatin isoform X2 [Nanorana parkeri]|uniref:cortistatin isoform X2 n=1 Tax=Nanorana parkeri TaxID=125878 RepID=UPI0008550814|nr:PREDICTED: cortistatin isoform X2 [Nanorana parkeri]
MFTAQLLLVLLAFCSVRSAVPIRRDKIAASSSREIDEVKKNNLVNVLLAILDWASPWADVDTMMNNEDPELQHRPQRSMYNPHMGREKGMCKNFFWKTFSAC